MQCGHTVTTMQFDHESSRDNCYWSYNLNIPLTNKKDVRGIIFQLFRKNVFFFCRTNLSLGETLLPRLNERNILAQYCFTRLTTTSTKHRSTVLLEQR